ncbi:hypothetical protein NXV57_19180 [Bacteroides thetaiotaomicron]|nr:hypothetical protein [Bacteroides thetaiotaomicron]
MNFEYHTLKPLSVCGGVRAFSFHQPYSCGERYRRVSCVPVETIRKETPKEFHIVGGCEGDYENENRLKRMRGCP